MILKAFHQSLGAKFTILGGDEAVAEYKGLSAEYTALRERAGVIDLSFRGRLCLTGADRVRFLHGQVTNDVKGLPSGRGCYAALVNAKGRMESDLNLHRLEDELLLDFEPGLSEKITNRLAKYIVADDVQIIDVSALYGLLSIQGPESTEVIRGAGLMETPPPNPFEFSKRSDPVLGEIYVMNQPRLGSCGFDVFAPVEVLEPLAGRLLAKATERAGAACGWLACELCRIETGIPRFGADMDESSFPQECGIEERAVSYNKGCYIGQEVLNRIHAIGHVNRRLCGLRLADDLKTLPAKGDKLFHNGKEVGWSTSAAFSPRFRSNLALAQIRNEAAGAGTELLLRTKDGDSPARVVPLPFKAL